MTTDKELIRMIQRSALTIYEHAEKFNGFPDDKIEYECSMTMIYKLSRKGYLKFTKR